LADFHRHVQTITRRKLLAATKLVPKALLEMDLTASQIVPKASVTMGFTAVNRPQLLAEEAKIHRLSAKKLPKANASSQACTITKNVQPTLIRTALNYAPMTVPKTWMTQVLRATNRLKAEIPHPLFALTERTLSWVSVIPLAKMG
jgi:hypothetical protein